MKNKKFLELFDQAINLINESENIYLLSHVNPDGDSLGSLLALSLALKKEKNNVFLVKADSTPGNLEFLPGVSLIEDYQLEDSHIDLLICLDSSDPGRLGDKQTFLKEAKKTINIDHHLSNSHYADVNIVDPQASACGQIVFDFIKHMGLSIDADIASNIYVAISTDTGSFSYESVSSKTHRVIAELLDCGVNIKYINNKLYERMPLSKLAVFKDVINSLEFYEDGKIILAKASLKILEDNQASWEDTEDLVSFIRKVEGVEVACLLKEYSKELIRVSLRSKEYIDVSEVCSHFQGGGHIRAAGCTIHSNLEEAEKLLIERVKKAFR